MSKPKKTEKPADPPPEVETTPQPTPEASSPAVSETAQAAGACGECGQIHDPMESHRKVTFGQKVRLNGVLYPAGTTGLYPASAPLFRGMTELKG